MREGVHQIKLLWIDDEIGLFDPDIRFLQNEGFQVDVAVTGVAGLAMATTCKHQVIVLDLRLPDMCGLAVLATLRAEAIKAPVLVLTGFGDFNCALAAGRLGADGFKSKPLFVDELAAALREIIGVAARKDGVVPNANEHLGDPEAVRFKSLATLLAELNRLASSWGNFGNTSFAETEAADSTHIRQDLVTALVRAVADPGLSGAAFLACARALRRVMDASLAERGETLATDAREFVIERLGEAESSHPSVVAALARLGVAAAQGRRVTLEAISDSINIDPPNLSRLISAETGFHFTDWRTAALLRPCLTLLISTKEQMKQIACSTLHFGHQTQFDREFHRFFGMTPTEFRRFAQPSLDAKS